MKNLLPALRHWPTHATAGERWRWLIFGAAALLAGSLILWLGRDLTFFNDECDFLLRIERGDPIDYLRPRNEHWVTVPFLAYVGVWRVFGFGSYLPFLALLLATHVALAAGVMQLLRPPLYALAAAVLLLFLGSGYENQLSAFQVTFVASTAFGVWALVAVQRDHDGWAAALLTASAASSLIGLAFIAAAVVMLGRSRRVMWLGLPLAVFAAWYVAFGRAGLAQHGPITLERLAMVPRFVLEDIAGSVGLISGLGPLVGAGTVLASIVLLVRWPDRHALGGLVGLVALFAIIGIGRAQFTGLAPRYVTPAAPLVFLMVQPLYARLALSPWPWVVARVGALVISVALAVNVLIMMRGAGTIAGLIARMGSCQL